MVYQPKMQWISYTRQCADGQSRRCRWFFLSINLTQVPLDRRIPREGSDISMLHEGSGKKFYDIFGGQLDKFHVFCLTSSMEVATIFKNVSCAYRKQPLHLTPPATATAEMANAKRQREIREEAARKAKKTQEDEDAANAAHNADVAKQQSEVDDLASEALESHFDAMSEYEHGRARDAFHDFRMLAAALPEPTGSNGEEVEKSLADLHAMLTSATARFAVARS